jgi:thiamine-phosphate pyrophosphorylase
VSLRGGLSPLTVLDVWLDAGVTLVQLRSKSASTGAFLDMADAARAATARSGARLIINDRADIARMVGADGVHVGQDDLTPADVRSIMGPTAWIGLSTHSAAQAAAAAASGASYLAIGPVFATHTKGARVDPVVGLDGVREACGVAAGLPVVAIGGITAREAGAVIAAGATSIAVIGDLVHGDPAERVRAFRESLGRI